MKVDNLFNAGAINDYSQNMNVQVNSVEAAAPDEQNGSGSTNIRLAKRFSKVDLYRVIIALQRSGCFEDENGNVPDDKQVFYAFGNMLGKDFSRYSNDLSQSMNKKTEVDIFKRLETVFVEYEEEKFEKQEKR